MSALDDLITEYGNIDCTRPLPPAVAHVTEPRVQPLLRKLNVAFAPAYVGYENAYGNHFFARHRGVVVLASDLLRVTLAIEERRQRSEKREMRARAALRALEDREVRFRQRLPKKVAFFFGTPERALPRACDALFDLNRYAADPEAVDRERIFALKSRLIRHLHEQERYTDRVEKLERRLPGQVCHACGGDGTPSDDDENWEDDLCSRCNGSGWWREPRTVCSYVFTFTVNRRRFCWIQPDFAITFTPRVEETRADDGLRVPPERVSLSARRREVLLAVVEFALSVVVHNKCEETESAGHA